MGLFEKLKQTLINTRNKLKNQFDVGELNDRKIDDNFFEELEENLILADVGIKTSEEIICDFKKIIKEKKIKFQREARLELIGLIANSLTLSENVSEEVKPRVILMLGVNGVGKTTTIAKLAHFFKNQNKKVVLAAADTFRAAAVDQLEIWATRVGCKIISHGQDSDPAAVVFDAVDFAKKNSFDVVLCDTAGRLHNKKNLMAQLQKMFRAAQRQLSWAPETFLVVDATMGQNVLNQVEEFKKTGNLTGVVLTKLDGTAKGGVALAVVRGARVPIKFIGLGEQISDLQEFDAESFAKALFD